MILNHFRSGLKMKSVQQENEPRRVESILYVSESNILFFVVSLLLCSNHTGSSWDHQLSSFTDHHIVFTLKYFGDRFTKKTLCLHCVFVPWLKTQWARRDTKPEIGNPSEFFLFFGCLCCCNSVIHLWAKISLKSLCGRDFQNVPTPKTD